MEDWTNERFRRYVITLVRDPEVRRDDSVVRAHVAFLRELDAQGKLELAGPFEDGRGGMYILRVGSDQEARTIAESDPFVQTGLSKSFEARAWILSCEENNHQGMG